MRGVDMPFYDKKSKENDKSYFQIVHFIQIIWRTNKWKIVV